MPRTTRARTQPDGAQIMICVESHICGALAGGPVYTRGTRLRADHPAIAASPAGYWMPDGMSDDEINHHLINLRATEPEPAPPDPHEPTVLRQLHDADALLCIRSTDFVPAGERIHADDWRVDEDRDAFIPVLPRGARREECVLALSNLSESTVDGETRTTVYRGQLIPRDSPLVKYNPSHSSLPAIEA